MGGLPEKPGEPGGRKALPKTHRGLTALGPAPAGPPQMGRRGTAGQVQSRGRNPEPTAAQTPGCGLKDQRALPGHPSPLRKRPAGPWASLS